MIRSLLSQVAVVSLLAIPSSGAPKLKDPDAGLKQWQGTWVYERQTIGGWDLPEDRRDKIWVVVEGDIMTKTGVAGSNLKYKFKLDPTTTPKSIDLVSHEHPSGKTFTHIGIYEWDGETLRMCFDNSGEKRPKEFRSPKEQDNIYLSVLKRKTK